MSLCKYFQLKLRSTGLLLNLIDVKSISPFFLAKYSDFSRELNTTKREKDKSLGACKRVFIITDHRIWARLGRGLPHWLRGKESTRNAGDVGSIPGSGRSPGGGHGYPLLYPCLKNPMDRGAWWLQSVGTQWVGHDWSNLAGTQFCNNQARLQLMAPPPSLPPNSTFLIWGHYPDSDIYLPTSGLNLKSFWINFLND